MGYCELEVDARKVVGTAAVSKLRRGGSVPGVVYSGGEEAQAIIFDEHDFSVIARKSVPTQLFKFKSKDSALNGVITLVKAVQKEPIHGKLLHVDFLAVKEGQRITVAVPVAIAGESIAVKEGRAILNQTAYELEIECMPSEIPASIPVDVSFLGEGQSIHAGDVTLPKGAVLKSSPELTIASTVGAKLMIEEEEEKVEEAAETPEEGAPETPGEPSEPTEEKKKE